MATRVGGAVPKVLCSACKTFPAAPAIGAACLTATAGWGKEDPSLLKAWSAAARRSGAGGVRRTEGSDLGGGEGSATCKRQNQRQGNTKPRENKQRPS